jgi:hypothetical protein
MLKKKMLPLHKISVRTLNRLRLESRKTLNLLLLVIAHPFDVERRTALNLQRGKEKEAQLADQRSKQDLFDLL